MANGSVQREYVLRDKASPTVISESVFITSTIDAKENRDIMTCDIPNAFVQTEIKKQEIGERIIMKILGILLEILVEMDPEKYSEYVVVEDGWRTVYVVMLKALYGMMMSLLLYNLKFRVGSNTRDGRDSGTNLGRRDTPRPIFRVICRPIQECARPILERDEKYGRRTRTRTSSKQLQFKNNRISDYTTILFSNVQRATTTIQYNKSSCFI